MGKAGLFPGVLQHPNSHPVQGDAGTAGALLPALLPSPGPILLPVCQQKGNLGLFPEEEGQKEGKDRINSLVLSFLKELFTLLSQHVPVAIATSDSRSNVEEMFKFCK